MDVVTYALLKKKLDGKASLVNGKIPADQLPSYVDDVIEGYYFNSGFYKDEAHAELITPETGKIYIDLTSGANKSYRWTGTTYVEVGGLTTEEVQKMIDASVGDALKEAY